MSRKSPWIVLIAVTLFVPTRADEPKLVQRSYAVGQLDRWVCHPILDTPASALSVHLTRLIAPQSWTGAGGTGTIRYDSDLRTLTVNATPEVHEQIPLALAELEQGWGRNVVIEVQSWRIPAALAQRLVDAGIPCKLTPQEAAPELHIVCLPDHCLKCMMEQVQQDCHRGVVRVPKITLLQDQVTTPWETLFCLPIDAPAMDSPSSALPPQAEPLPRGLVLSVQPLIATDRHPIHLRLKLQTASLAHLFGSSRPVDGFVAVDPERYVECIPFSELIPSSPPGGQCLDRIVAVDEGQTIVISGWKLHGEQAAGVNGPDEYLLLLITPRLGAQHHHGPSGSCSAACRPPLSRSW